MNSSSAPSKSKPLPKTKEDLPKGCYRFINHNRILRRNIYRDRPGDQCNISCERVIRHGFIVKPVVWRYGFLWHKKETLYYAVHSTTTYEMAGDYCGSYLGGRRWSETDLTGLEWRFHSEEDANKFIQENS